MKRIHEENQRFSDPHLSSGNFQQPIGHIHHSFMQRMGLIQTMARIRTPGYPKPAQNAGGFQAGIYPGRRKALPGNIPSPNPAVLSSHPKKVIASKAIKAYFAFMIVVAADQQPAAAFQVEADGIGILGIFGVVQHQHIAVSYTHLDVYKRQFKRASSGLR